MLVAAMRSARETWKTRTRFLADEARSGFVNGQVLDLAGGQQMGRLPRF